MALAGVTSDRAAAQQGAPRDFVVNCFNEALQTVQDTLSGECQGKVVSDEEAAKIKARRAAYIRRVLFDKPTPVAPGKRLFGTGSGFFVSADGAILTSHHVISSCSVVSVTPPGTNAVRAEIVQLDKTWDLALLRADLEPQGIASFALTVDPTASNEITVVGYPNRGRVTIKPVRASGQALGIKIAKSGLPLLVLKVDVRPGNSGGPVLDARGNVIGIVFAQINTPQVYKKTGDLLRDIGFAVPSQVILQFLERAGIRIKPKVIDDGGDKPDSRKTPFVAQVGCWR